MWLQSAVEARMTAGAGARVIAGILLEQITGRPPHRSNRP
jgi:hypothetical protein